MSFRLCELRRDVRLEVVQIVVCPQLVLESNVLRGMDAIHIGSAVAIGADVFVTADQRQRDAGRVAG